MGQTRSVVSPSPSWPWLLLPQANTAPLLVTARVWLPPHATPATGTPARLSTSVGLNTMSLLRPSPSCPLLLLPQV